MGATPRLAAARMDSVTRIYAVMKNGERVDWPIWDDRETAQRCFAVITDCQAWQTSRCRPHRARLTEEQAGG